MAPQSPAHLHIRSGSTERNFVLDRPERAIVTGTIRCLFCLQVGTSAASKEARSKSSLRKGRQDQHIRCLTFKNLNNYFLFTFLKRI